MTVETNARFLSDLNEAYPRSQDLIKEGDDHIRLIKNVVKNTFPGFNSALTTSSDKLNKLDKSLKYEGETLVLSSDIKLGDGKIFDANSRRITNLSDPAADTDAVSLKFVKNSVGGVAWPVNSVFLTFDDRNPADLLGIGTWERVSQGRLLIGAGTGTDDNGLPKTFPVGSFGGEYYHTLKAEETPQTSFTQEIKTLFKEVDILPPKSVSNVDGHVSVGCSVTKRYKAGTKVLIRGTALGEGYGTTSIGIVLKTFKNGANYSEKGYAITVGGTASSEVVGSTAVLLHEEAEYKFEAMLNNPYPSGAVGVRHVTIEVSEVL